MELHKKFGPSAPFENLTPQNDWKKYLCKEYTKSCKLKRARATRHKFSPKKIGWQKVDLPRKKLRALKCDKEYARNYPTSHFRSQGFGETTPHFDGPSLPKPEHCEEFPPPPPPMNFEKKVFTGRQYPKDKQREKRRSGAKTEVIFVVWIVKFDNRKFLRKSMKQRRVILELWKVYLVKGGYQRTIWFSVFSNIPKKFSACAGPKIHWNVWRGLGKRPPSQVKKTLGEIGGVSFCPGRKNFGGGTRNFFAC